MPKLNWEIILSNLAEAREQIEEIKKLAKEGKKPSGIELQIKLEHVYHHLNFAWNIRHKSSFNYSKLSNEEFNEWSKFPTEIKEKNLPKEFSDKIDRLRNDPF